MAFSRWQSPQPRALMGSRGPLSPCRRRPLPMADQFLQLLVNGLITGTVLALTGVGATLVFGIQRIANFAHGELLTFGAYVGLFLNVDAGQSLPVATVGAILATGLLALALHFAVLRPLRNRGLVAMSLVTVGLGLMLRDLLFMIAG